MMEKGNSRVKTTLTRWKPDWDGAAVCYDRAAICYKNCRENDKAFEAYKKLSTAYDAVGNHSGAAKALENASVLINDPIRATELLEAAGSQYQLSGLPERAAEAFSKAARAIEPRDEEKAGSLMMTACSMFDDPEKYAFARDVFLSTLTMAVRHKNFQRAVEVLRQHSVIYKHLNQMPNCWKCYLSIVVLLLAKNDFDGADAANNEFMQIDGYTTSEEFGAASELLDAFEKGDGKILAKVLQNQAFQYIDNSVARLARDLKIVEGPQKRANVLEIDSYQPENDAPPVENGLAGISFDDGVL
jgi:tetratricopeptide (TPR) repeat protein